MNALRTCIVDNCHREASGNAGCEAHTAEAQRLIGEYGSGVPGDEAKTSTPTTPSPESTKC